MPEPIESLQEILRLIDLSAGAIRDLIEAAQIFERRIAALEAELAQLKGERAA